MIIDYLLPVLLILMVVIGIKSLIEDFRWYKKIPNKTATELTHADYIKLIKVCQALLDTETTVHLGIYKEVGELLKKSAIHLNESVQSYQPIQGYQGDKSNSKPPRDE